MYKFTNKNMLTACAVMVQEGEKALYPVYGSMGQQTSFGGGALNNTFGYAAVTDKNRLIVCRFNFLGMPVDNFSYSLYDMTKLNTSRFMKLHTLKMTFETPEGRKKVHIKANEHVHGADFFCQELNLSNFISYLEKFRR